MAIKNAGKEIALDALATACAYASLHSGFPCTTLNEIAGGDPAYAREAASFGAASEDTVELDAEIEFDVQAGDTVGAVAFCVADVEAADDYLADDDVTDEAFGGQGTYTVTAGSITIDDPA